MPSSAIRKAASALVTLTADTPASDIDAAVSALNGRYMGYGFWLSIVRHLSSAVAGSAAAAIPTIGAPSHPFDARAPRPSHGRGGQHHSSNHHHHRGGFAPPSSFGQGGGGGGGRRERHHQQQQQQQQPSNALQIHVQAPGDLKILKLIHRTIEALLTHGPEFEALLMSQDSVRQDPKFAWLWDARSEAGVYYRWKLWEILTGFSIDKPFTPIVELFDTANSVWIPPRRPLKYEFANSLEDVVDDYSFQSDEDEDGSDQEHHHHNRPHGRNRSHHRHQKHQSQHQSHQDQNQHPHPSQQAGPSSYLGVLERAKLLHLVARVPTTTSKVRRGDVGRVMAFAMEHAEGGKGEEVVTVLVANVLRPLAFTRVAPSASASLEADASSAKIVALWLISDVLSNSSLGVRAAWRYRQLFENALRERRVFAHLGDIYRESGWGRMKAEKFRRMVVEGVLEGWEVRRPAPFWRAELR